MGVPREDLLLMLRAMKRGAADLKALRRALDRMSSRPLPLDEALHLDPDAAKALRNDTWSPDPQADRALLDELRRLLLDAGALSEAEWDRAAGSLVRSTVRIAHPPLPVPTDFDGYTLQWEIARREHGVVYRAKDREGNDVAIKVFRKTVPAQGLPSVDGHAYAVAPFEEGETLEAARRHGLRWAAAALAKAAALVKARPHGGLSPIRILVRRDDGVAVLGYEHVKAVPPSARTLAYGPGDDVKALGAILYEAVTGAPPAGGVSPAAAVKDCDAALDRVVSAALTGGYPDAGALGEDLGRWLKGEPVTARKAVAPAAASKRGLPWGWIAAGAALAAGALAAVLATRSDPPPAPPAPVPVAAAPPAPPPPAPRPKPPPAPVRPVEVSTKPLTPAEDQQLYDHCLKAMGRGDSARVIELAHEAVARGTKRDWPYAHLVHAFTDRGELDKALEYALRATERWPDNRDFLQLRAETYAFRGQASRALEDFGKLHGGKAAELNREILRLSQEAEADSQDPRPLLLRGVVYLLKKHHDTAARDFTRAIELGMRRALAWRAHAAAGMGDAARSKQDAKAYLSEFPSDYASAELRELTK
jgi:tetratricopeptide (TPR) repeat protein